MKGPKRHRPEQILRRLAEGDEMLNKGATVAEAARAFGITETTWYRWKQTYGGMKGPDVKRLKELEAENRRAKKLVAEQALDIDSSEELAEGNF